MFDIPGTKQFIGAPFFADSDYFQDPSHHLTSLEINGFKIPCKITEVCDYQGYITGDECREGVYINIITNSDNIILSIDGATYITLSEKFSKEYHLDASERYLLSKILNNCTFDKIDFANAAELYDIDESDLCKIAIEYFHLVDSIINSMLEKNQNYYKSISI